MNNRKYVKNFLLLIFIFTAAVLFSDLKENSKSGEADYSGYGISGNPDYHKLLQKPVRIIKKYDKDKEKDRFSIISDYHMLIPCSVDDLACLLADLDTCENVFPRMADSEVYYHAQFPEDIYYQRVKTDFETLGIGKEYEYTLKVFFDERTGSRFKMRWALNESLDNSFSVFEGSWYCEEVEFENKKYTYLRNFTETEFIDPGFFTVFAVKHFSEGEIKRAFRSITSALQ